MKRILISMTLCICLLLTSVLALTGCKNPAGSGDVTDPGTIPADEQNPVAEFTVSSDEPLMITDQTFDGTVVISGDSGTIMFQNCRFNGNIVNTADFFTRVILLPGCEVTGKCILRNSIQKVGTSVIDYPVPKFVSYVPISAETKNCLGAVVGIGNISVSLNGKSYTMSDATKFYDGTELVSFSGQEANLFAVICYMEDDAFTTLVVAQYDPDV